MGCSLEILVNRVVCSLGSAPHFGCTCTLRSSLNAATSSMHKMPNIGLGNLHMISTSDSCPLTWQRGWIDPAIFNVFFQHPLFADKVTVRMHCTPRDTVIRPLGALTVGKQTGSKDGPQILMIARHKISVIVVSQQQLFDMLLNVRCACKSPHTHQILTSGIAMSVTQCDILPSFDFEIIVFGNGHHRGERVHDFHHFPSWNRLSRKW